LRGEEKSFRYNKKNKRIPFPKQFDSINVQLGLSHGAWLERDEDKEEQGALNFSSQDFSEEIFHKNSLMNVFFSTLPFLYVTYRIYF
jgi:hypothetical protein